ncbi:uncharacterized protein LOC135825700 [Sycon ciliatum]|uniref:uncharacterized protein LOC135825700 n=1 Tax=Sycon ciliatum TaxID=27933 RepID=UPI0031F63B37
MALTWLTFLLAAVIGVVAGVLIGCIGVGGVVIVPLLILRHDVDIHLAVVACMAAYVPAGLAGAVAYVRKRAVPWHSAVFMCLPAALAALLGSWTLVRLSAHVVKLVLYSIMLGTSCLSAVRSLHAVWTEKKAEQPRSIAGTRDTIASGMSGFDRQSNSGAASLGEDSTAFDDGVHSMEQEQARLMAPDGDEKAAGPGILSQNGRERPVVVAGASTNHRQVASDTSTDKAMCCFGSLTGVQLVQALLVGMLAGFGSALTGTSGPVLLLPMLFILLWPALPALGCAQVIQVPIACAATVGNLFFATSQVDLHDMFKLAGCVAAGLVPFVFVGAAIADHLPQRTLKITVALLLVVASLVLLLREVL